MKRVRPIIGDKIKMIIMALFLWGIGSFLLPNPAYAEWRLFAVNTNLQDASSGTLSVIRLSDSAKITDIPLSASYAAHSVAVHPNGLKAYVTGGAAGYNRGITIIDTLDNSVAGAVSTAEAASRGIAFTPAGGDAYVCMVEDNVVRRIDSGTDSVVGPPIATHSGPSYIVITSDGKKAYVACNSGGIIDVIDLSTDPPVVTTSVDLSSSNLQNLAFDADESHLYVTDAGNNRIRVIRTSDDIEVTPSFFPTINRYPRAIALSDDNLYAYVGVRDGTYANSVLAIRLSDGAIVRQVVDSDPLQGISNPRVGILSPDGSRFYVTCHNQSRVAAIGTSDYGFFYIPAGPNPVGLDLADVPLPISVTSPNGGEKWQRGKTYPITWTYTSDPGPDVKLELLKGGGLTSTITAATPAGAGGSGSYSWTIPPQQAKGSDYRIRIASTTDSSIMDTSDGDFSIVAVKASQIKVKTPDGGEIWEAGTTQTIEWGYFGPLPAPRVKIELLEARKKNGDVWVIAKRSSLSTGTTYQITITSATSSSYRDTSDNFFNIVP
jgi:DNA-binding beta-propeller fold protein YncE